MQKVITIPMLLFIISMVISPIANADGVDRLFSAEAHSNVSRVTGFNKSYALVIGSNQSKGAFPDIANAEHDAIRIKNFLIKEAGFKEVQVITGKNATLQRIRSILHNDIAKKVGSQDRFILYWSGHGVTQISDGKPQGYLALADSKKNDLSTLFSLQELLSFNSKLRAKQVLYLLDANVDGIPGMVKSRPGSQTPDQIAQPTRQILTAGYSADNASHSGNAGSLFARSIMSGLRGFADKGSGESKEDGIITSSELAAYVRYHVTTKTKQTSPPKLLNLSSGPGEFFFISKSSAPQYHTKAIPAAAPSRGLTDPRKSPPQPVKPRPATSYVVKPAPAPKKQEGVFPWPPPRASSMQLLSTDFLSNNISLLTASKEISKALSEAGQDERRFYTVPGGFAIVTRLELISKNGDRIMQVMDDEIDFFQYIKGLFWKKSLSGNFRMIAFIVTDQPFGTTGDSLTKREANDLLQQGYNKLPSRYDSLNFTTNHDITALVYEFSKSEKKDYATLVDPGFLSANEHLTKLGWYRAIQILTANN